MVGRGVDGGGGGGGVGLGLRFEVSGGGGCGCHQNYVLVSIVCYVRVGFLSFCLGHW